MKGVARLYSCTATNREKGMLFTILETNSVFSRSVEKSDAQLYSCTASNEEEGSATAHVNLIVLGKKKKGLFAGF